MSLWCTRISQNFLLLLFPLFFLLSYPRSFLLSTPFLLGGKVWTKSLVNPEKGSLISSRCVGLFMRWFCTKKGVCFFRLALSECSRCTKWRVLWKDLSSLCQLLIWKADWRENWWHHKLCNDRYSKCWQKSTFAVKELNRVEEGKREWEKEGVMKKKLLLKEKPNWKLKCKNQYPIYDQNRGKMAKIDTQFMTKTAEKPYPLGATHTYIAHIREYPPWGALKIQIYRVKWWIDTNTKASNLPKQGVILTRKTQQTLVLIWQSTSSITVIKRSCFS